MEKGILNDLSSMGLKHILKEIDFLEFTPHLQREELLDPYFCS